MIYLDPPFNSDRVYNLVYYNKTTNSTAQQKAFHDMWTPSAQTQLMFEQFSDELKSNNSLDGSVRQFLEAWMGALKEGNMASQKLLNYLLYMTERLIVLRDVLKDSGSIYLHCDPTASHYLKVIMDSLFGRENFRNDIIWQRTNNPKGSQFKEKKFGTATDNILFYTKSKNYYFELTQAKTALTDDELKVKYPKNDEKGAYYEGPIECSASMGDRPNLCYEYKGYTNRYPSGWRMTKEKLTQLDEAGDLGWNSKQRPFRKLRPSNDHGLPIFSLWTDINRLYHSKEYLGYPTQKPKVLLERIIKASCPEGGTVLDPFCGCGTTIDAAIQLNRQWYGVDISTFSVELIKERIASKGVDYELKTIQPASWDEYNQLNPFEKQDYLIKQLGGMSNPKKTGDGGVDGELTVHLGLDKDGKDNWGKVIFSVKTGNQCQPSFLDELEGVVLKHQAHFGVLILDKDASFNMQTRVDGSRKIKYHHAKNMPPQEFSYLQIYTAREILEGAKLLVPPSIIAVKNYRKAQLELFQAQTQ